MSYSWRFLLIAMLLPAAARAQVTKSPVKLADLVGKWKIVEEDSLKSDSLVIRSDGAWYGRLGHPSTAKKRFDKGAKTVVTDDSLCCQPSASRQALHETWKRLQEEGRRVDRVLKAWSDTTQPYKITLDADGNRFTLTAIKKYFATGSYIYERMRSTPSP